MKRSLAGALIAAGMLLGGPAAEASGTYRGGPPRAPTSIDREAYDRGKAIFAGTAELQVHVVDAEAQLSELQALQEKLPKSTRGSRDLTALAGKLSAEQVKQLRYFLEVRYKVKVQ